MATRNAIKETLDTVSRSQLGEALSIVKPALGKTAFVPVLGHFCFDGEHVTAYDDMIAISVKHKMPVACAVPADLLLKLMGSLSAEDMRMTMDGAALRVKCGRSDMTLPALSPDAFIFKRTISGKKRAHIEDLDGNFIQGISRCLVSVGQDATHPSQMGITMTSNDHGDVWLYSTDNVTMSAYDVGNGTRIGDDMTVILPTEFCRNLVSLHEKCDDDDAVSFTLYEHCVVAMFGDWGLLFAKLVINDKPLDFASVVERLVGDYTNKHASELPSGWVPAFQRAAAIADPAKPIATVTADGDELTIVTKSKMGECHDELECDGQSCKPFEVDPMHVLRASPLCKLYALRPEVLVMADGHFMHMISHCVTK